MTDVATKNLQIQNSVASELNSIQANASTL